MSLSDPGQLFEHSSSGPPSPPKSQVIAIKSRSTSIDLRHDLWTLSSLAYYGGPQERIVSQAYEQQQGRYDAS
jgi:hypothetical protein